MADSTILTNPAAFSHIVNQLQKNFGNQDIQAISAAFSQIVNQLQKNFGNQDIQAILEQHPAVPLADLGDFGEKLVSAIGKDNMIFAVSAFDRVYESGTHALQVLRIINAYPDLALRESMTNDVNTFYQRFQTERLKVNGLSADEIKREVLGEEQGSVSYVLVNSVIDALVDNQTMLDFTQNFALELPDGTERTLNLVSLGQIARSLDVLPPEYNGGLKDKVTIGHILSQTLAGELLDSGVSIADATTYQLVEEQLNDFITNNFASLDELDTHLSDIEINLESGDGAYQATQSDVDPLNIPVPNAPSASFSARNVRGI